MAQAGYCSECGKNVYLTPEGTCPAGHEAECISKPYDVPEAGELAPEEAPVATEADAAPQVGAEAPSAPVYPPSATPVTPQRNRTGLIVIIIAAIVILGACLGTGLLLVPAMRKASTPGATTSAVSPEKQKVEAAVGFIQALFSADAVKIKPYLVDSAQSAITTAQWATVASSIPTVPVTFTTPKWTTDTTAVTTFTTPDATGAETTGTIVIGSGAATTTPNALALELTAQGSTEGATMVLTKVGTTWRIVSIVGSAGDTTAYDSSFVKQMLADSATN
jgi:hypothetical protein